jgi:putative IMPACT (imprinted ancient) family translation regulator
LKNHFGNKRHLKTIEIPTEEVLFKEKNSKFYGYAFPVTSTEEIKIQIEQLEIHSQKLEENCELIIVARKKNAKRIFDIFDSLFEISISKLDI